MSEHPLNDLIGTALTNIKSMIDVNTIIGNAVETANGTTIIPVSRVGFGFAAGGSDVPSKAPSPSPNKNFGGGSGAGISISPVGFLVVNGDSVKLLPVNSANTTVDKLIDSVPELFDKVNGLINKNKSGGDM